MRTAWHCGNVAPMRAEVSRLAYPFLQAEAGAFLPSVAPSPLVLLVESVQPIFLVVGEPSRRPLSRLDCIRIPNIELA
jgi:hypothetical protein